MVTRQQLQPTRIRPIALKPIAVKSERPALRTAGRPVVDRFLTRVALFAEAVDIPGWLRRETQLPAWQMVLTAVLIVLVSVTVPAMSLHRSIQNPTSSSGGSLPINSGTLPIDPPVSSAAIQTQSQPVTNADAAQQIVGLHDASQELLKQIEQAQHDNAALRSQIQAQDQNLGAVQSAAIVTDAEQTTQQQQLQEQTAAALQTAADRLAELSKSVTALDDQANILRQTLGMSKTSYPAVSIPDLSTAADPQQAFNSALTSLGTHISAVSTDLQTIKSTAQNQLAFAQSIGSVRPVGVSQVYGTGQLAWPTTGSISQEWGPTSLALEPAYGAYDHFHFGIDIANNQGTPIAAAAAGVVVYAGWTDAGYGNMVQIDHGNGLVTIYGHMMSTPVVTVGQRVFQGQLIGYMGTTGNSTGPHLHFGVQDNGSWDNPLKYLP